MRSLSSVDGELERRMQAFQAVTYDLSKGRNASLRLEPIDNLAARMLAETISSLDPWRRLGIAASSLAQHLTEDDNHLRRSHL